MCEPIIILLFMLRGLENQFAPPTPTLYSGGRNNSSRCRIDFRTKCLTSALFSLKMNFSSLNNKYIIFCNHRTTFFSEPLPESGILEVVVWNNGCLRFQIFLFYDNIFVLRWSVIGSQWCTKTIGELNVKQNLFFQKNL